jgi:hypothetical protein
MTRKDIYLRLSSRPSRPLLLSGRSCLPQPDPLRSEAAPTANRLAPEAGWSAPAVPSGQGRKAHRSHYCPSPTERPLGLSTRAPPKGLASLSTINGATMRVCKADRPASRHPFAAGSRSHINPGGAAGRGVYEAKRPAKKLIPHPRPPDLCDTHAASTPWCGGLAGEITRARFGVDTESFSSRLRGDGPSDPVEGGPLVLVEDSADGVYPGLRE